jgi:hypothetical protein
MTPLCVGHVVQRTCKKNEAMKKQLSDGLAHQRWQPVSFTVRPEVTQSGNYVPAAHIVIILITVTSETLSIC